MWFSVANLPSAPSVADNRRVLNLTIGAFVGVFEFGMMLAVLAAAQGVRWLRWHHEDARYKRVAAAVHSDAKSAIDEAESLVRFTRKHRKGEHLAWALQQLALAYEADGRFEDALEKSREAYRTRKESSAALEAAYVSEREAGIELTQEKQDVLAMAYSLESSARILSRLGRFAEAHRDLDQAQALRRREAASEDVEIEVESDAAIVDTLMERSRLAKRQRDYPAQVALLRRVVAATTHQRVEAGPYRSALQHRAANDQPSHGAKVEGFDYSVEARLELASALFTLGERSEARRLEASCLQNAETTARRQMVALGNYLQDRHYLQVARLCRDSLDGGERTGRNLYYVASLEPSDEVALEFAKRALSEPEVDDSWRASFHSLIADLCFKLDRTSEGMEHPPVSSSEPLASAKWRAGDTAAATEMMEEITMLSPAPRASPVLDALQAGFWHLERGQLHLAHHAAERAYSMAMAPFSEWDRCTIVVLCALIEMHDGDIDEARQRLEEEANTASVYARGQVAHCRGLLDIAVGHYHSAEARFAEAVEFFERSSALPSALAIALRSLREAQGLNGRWNEAAATHERFVAKGFAKNSSDGAGAVADCVYRAGALRAKIDESALEDGFAEVREALRVTSHHFGEESTYLPGLYALTSEYMREAGTPKEALVIAENATALASKLWGDEHVLMAIPQHARGRALRALGRKSEAKAAFAHALRLMAANQHDRRGEVEADLDTCV